jgi:Na+/H+-translocating membrane pyrophosphatase
MDADGDWWYFFTPLIGGATVIVPCFLITAAASEAGVRCAFKSKNSLRYAHKVAFRTGMFAVFLTFGLGLFVLTLSLFVYEQWWAEDTATKYADMTFTLLSFAFAVGLAALSVRFSGLLYGSTTNVGEVMIIKENSQEADVNGNPGTTSYCIGEIMD